MTRRVLLLLGPDPARQAAGGAVRHPVRPVPGAQREEFSLIDAPPGGRFKARAGLLAVMGLIAANEIDCDCC